MFSKPRTTDAISMCSVINLESQCMEFHPQANPYWLGNGRNLQCSILWGQVPNGFYILERLAW
jgi:hypothetical protein